MKVYMETLGCPKNFNDTQVAKGIMVNGGIEIVDEIESLKQALKEGDE